MNNTNYTVFDGFDFDKLKQSKITVVTHINPDGDALGSLLGIYNFFAELGTAIVPVTPNAIPAIFSAMPGFSNIQIFEENKDAVSAQFAQSDYIIITDFNSPKRVGDMETILVESPAVKIMIDHHPEPDAFAQYIISNIFASSASELVYGFIKLANGNKPVSKNVASCIYTGIMTDTGNFSYNSSNPETFRTVAELLETGIDKLAITDMVFNNYTESRMRLMGFVLNTKMIIRPKFQTGYITLSTKEKDFFKFENGDAEGFVNWPLSIREVKFSAIFMENDGYIKASFRSKGNFDTNTFARKHFNGGGHVNASGGKFYGSLPDAISLFEKLLRVYAEKLQN
ncbi:MAG TPA: DHH family phosphoesterase [Bacteroidales bacterium]|nr:DHH family phosphoesterase [Bacteroidales bacterium]